MEENIRKAVAFVLAVVGLLIFYTVLMMKIETFAHETNAKVQRLSSEFVWEDFRHQNTVHSIIEKNERESVNP